MYKELPSCLVQRSTKNILFYLYSTLRISLRKLNDLHSRTLFLNLVNEFREDFDIKVKYVRL